MAAEQRIYKVTGNGTQHLVQASSQAQALRHVAGKQYQVEVAKAVDVAHIMGKGGTVEHAASIAEQLEINAQGELQ
jgi:type II secretory pathway component GspD/PulD (secretin)